jgi:hypothetical protein
VIQSVRDDENEVGHSSKTRRHQSGLGARRSTKAVVASLLELFAIFGSSVLEPDLDLTLAQSQHGRQLGLSSNGDVAGVVELLLQLQTLVIRRERRRMKTYLVEVCCCIECDASNRTERRVNCSDRRHRRP